jgi:hypothetical protein
MSTWETGKPDASEGLRPSSADTAESLRASGVPHDRSAQVHSALRVSEA